VDGDHDSGDFDPPHAHSLGLGSPRDGDGCVGWILIVSLLYGLASLVFELLR
jgi:hypothetical protein